jgi:hypothetical protein
MQRYFLVLLYSFFLLFMLGACAREVYDIAWKGVVVDKNTGKPVAGAHISTTCSYQHNIDVTAEFDRFSTSNDNGQFIVSFPKGFGLTVRTSAPGYLSGLDYKVVKRSFINDTVFLSPRPLNTNLVVRIKNDTLFSASVPFICEMQVVDGVRGGKNGTVRWGYDFLAGESTNRLEEADVWVEIVRNSNRLMLNTGENGGIFPVYQNDNDDFLTHVTKAPESGYANSHLLTGDEAGFFVLCRNGRHVAKMIPEKRICILNYSSGAGQRLKETGIRFDYLFQPDLENRLYFPVSVSALGLEINNDFNETSERDIPD